MSISKMGTPELIIRHRQLQITQELSGLSPFKKEENELIRELLEEYSRLDEALKRFAEK